MLPPPLTRRSLLHGSAALLANTAFRPCWLFAQGASTSLPEVSLHLTFGSGGAVVPADFLGLSYETKELANPAFFSPRNIGLVQQFRNLAPRGVLRLGGNSSDFGWWQATPTDTAPPRSGGVAVPGEPPPNYIFAITPNSIRELRGFLDAVNWSCIYGLNLGHGSPAADAAEAAFVATTLGTRLQYFQIGNEPDLFDRHLRDKAAWNVDSYLREWLPIATAVQRNCPDVRFALPDVANNLEWIGAIADRWSLTAPPLRLAALTHHHYIGAADNATITAESILQPDPRVARAAAAVKSAAARLKLSYRMTEGNTCYGGGKPGVSDVFAAALWSAEYLFSLMQAGYSGVNLHGGGHVAPSPSASPAHPSASPAEPPHPSVAYTPIAAVDGAEVSASRPSGTYTLEPVGAGMKFAAAFAGCTVLPVELTAPGNITAFAARRRDGRILVAILNKEPSQAFQFTAPRFQTIQVLSGASLTSRTARVSTVVAERSSRRAGDVQTFILPPHFATLLILE